MRVLIDAGNSRVKWTWHDGVAPFTVRAVDSMDVAAMDASALARAWRAATSASYACVAGDGVDAMIRAALPAGCAAHRVRAARACCGITNFYAEPTQLGADRWLAVIGARALHAGPLIVATAGTATTVDALDADDRFLGGYILPGLQLMLESLARNTAGLPLARGKVAQWPRNTDDAIHSACVDAQAALIERAREQLGDDATVLLSGGAAGQIAPRLRCPFTVADHLVLQGLIRFHESGAAPDVVK
ncbi:MAG: type III pantothenate kinase [Gammaproteobacteria bacterium]|jgi:type III pantothenate kinase|nr:type III pantothenate kinase [Gammaproteobacteria bacterium]MBU0770741.1 type III pantothenate kinase [Gammaproteobacteria bacterium]MBU0857615.1 type III pantothenate kinase [Gammaproteobacteria bacterium]MBU1848641.1 type III pantothenate kinase [Gammaproteobacteria bacterium]